MKLNTPFPGRRRKMAETKRETPVMEARERREEKMAKRPVLKLNKRGK